MRVWQVDLSSDYMLADAAVGDNAETLGLGAGVFVGVMHPFQPPLTHVPPPRPTSLVRHSRAN